jgi:2-oxoglutarate ferredoxin oxidoreductase subunit alpha
VIADSDEHDEEGHITEDLAVTVPRMADKRLRKFDALRSAMTPPEWIGSAEAATLLVSWGSTRGAVAEAVETLTGNGHSVAAVHFTELWPLPPDPLPAGRRLLGVEGNATGQLAKLLSAEFSLRFHGAIRRTDGLPLDAACIVDQFTALGG